RKSPSTEVCLLPSPGATQRPSQIFQLPPPIEFVHKGTRIPPARLNLDEEFQKYLGSSHSFHFMSVRRADFFQHLPSFSSQDGLLSFAVAVDRRRHPREPRPFLKLIHHHRGGV